MTDTTELQSLAETTGSTWTLQLDPDSPAEEDELGRDEFAANLARTIFEYNSKECITIGVHGPWGSGKTTLLNMVQKKLIRLREDWRKKPEQQRFAYKELN